jgi:16S rRNA G966 N2-methylase RsmD
MIKIDPEFQALIPPLAPEERQQLEANILADGCRDPLVVWNGVLIDGHNRYEICTKHGIGFETVEKEFADRSEAIEWIIRNQFGRRNLTAYVRTQLALRLEETIAKRAKANQVESGREFGKGCQKSDKPINPIDTKKEVAKIASVSHDTVAKVKVIEQKAAPEVKQKLSTGEVSINQAYQEIRKEEKKAKQSEVLHSRSADKARKTAKLKNSLFEVRRGDFREVLGDVESVSLILTDPPYPKDALPLWRDLGRWAADALADDGILVAYSGQLYLPQVLNNLSESLEYWWCGAVVHKGTGNLTPLSHPVRKVINCWKPLVMFYKKGGVGFERTFKDLVEGVGPQKTDHNWQQPVEEAKMIINAFTNPGDLVVDPFAGSGGFCKAAHELGRIAVGAEILNDE